MSPVIPYTVRPMEARDVPAVAAIERLSFPAPWPISTFWYELTANGTGFYFVLLRPTERPGGGRWKRWLAGMLGLPEETPVIGYVGFRLLNDAEAHITTLAVHPDWRGRGLGELLLLTALESALARDPVRRVSLEARASNEIAQRLYRKYGFRFRRVMPGYYRDGEDAWLMEVEVRETAYRERLAELRRQLEARLSAGRPT